MHFHPTIIPYKEFDQFENTTQLTFDSQDSMRCNMVEGVEMCALCNEFDIVQIHIEIELHIELLFSNVIAT